MTTNTYNCRKVTVTARKKSQAMIPWACRRRKGLWCNSVSTAAAIDQSLRLIDAHVFDAATLDVNLDGTCSYPVAETLVRRGVPFVFSTGYDAHFLRDEYRNRP